MSNKKNKDNLPPNANHYYINSNKALNKLYELTCFISS